MKRVADSGYTPAQLYKRYFRGLIESGADAEMARKRAREWAGEHDLLVEVEDGFDGIWWSVEVQAGTQKASSRG